MKNGTLCPQCLEPIDTDETEYDKIIADCPYCKTFIGSIRNLQRALYDFKQALYNERGYLIKVALISFLFGAIVTIISELSK